jgi:hypothetical protein
MSSEQRQEALEVCPAVVPILDAFYREAGVADFEGCYCFACRLRCFCHEEAE